MKVVGYVRVSTDRQAEHGLGLEVQERAVRKWARQKGHKLIAVLREEGVSGSNGIEDREALPEALAMLAGGARARGLVVFRLDRLARDLVVQETLLAEVWRLGAEVFSTASGEADLRDDPDDPSRRLIRQVLGAVAEYERAMTVMRLRMGRARKAERGGYAYGGPPYGYRAEGGALAPEPEEQDAIARAIELRQEGKSLRQIAAALQAEGHPTRRGGPWQPNTVSRALRALALAQEAKL